METRNLEQTVSEILEDVRINGDEAVKQYTTLFDKAELDRLDVSPEEFEAAFRRWVGAESVSRPSLARTHLRPLRHWFLWN